MGWKRYRLKSISEGILERAVDMALVLVYFNLEVAPLVRNKRNLIERKVDEDLEKFNYQNLKRAFLQLRRNGLIQTFKEKNALDEITKIGLEKLKNIIPFYDEKRVWDGKIYIITYDIPEKLRSKRNHLREFLKKIGCGNLQQSIWLTPYNPINLINKFVSENDISDELIIVSSLGKNGTIGNSTLLELVERVYHLEEINRKYFEFISIIKENKEKRFKLIFRYLNILKDDPQLPFSLLPEDWVGDDAYLYFKRVNKQM